MAETVKVGLGSLVLGLWALVFSSLYLELGTLFVESRRL
jgi:hypothetical protein